MAPHKFNVILRTTGMSAYRYAGMSAGHLHIAELQHQLSLQLRVRQLWKARIKVVWALISAVSRSLQYHGADVVPLRTKPADLNRLSLTTNEGIKPVQSSTVDSKGCSEFERCRYVQQSKNCNFAVVNWCIYVWQQANKSLWSADFGSLIETWEVDRILPGTAWVVHRWSSQELSTRRKDSRLVECCLVHRDPSPSSTLVLQSLFSEIKGVSQ